MRAKFNSAERATLTVRQEATLTTVRLDTATEATLQRLAKQRGQTKSELIRDAISRLAEEEEGALSALDQLQPYIGIADSGGQQLATRTGQQFRALLEEKRRARDPG